MRQLIFHKEVMKKYVVRVNEDFFFKSFEGPFISALLGPRRVGKTTLIEYYMTHHADRLWVHLNMDVLSQRNRIAQEELALMIEQSALQKIGGPKKIWVFIDEAQKSPELFDQIKIIYDAHKGHNHIKFILTGSAHLNLHKLAAESLAGRIQLLNLREFNLREMALLTHQRLTLPHETVLSTFFDGYDSEKLENMYKELRPFQNIFEESLANHLLWGGLPETIEQPDEKSRLKYLGDYLQTYLEKDIRSLETISDLHLYQNLMKICAELTGSLQDDKKIIEALHCSRNTLIKYRNYFLATLQYVEIYPFIESSVKRLVKSPKGYVVNNGLVSYLTGLYASVILKNSGLIGHRFENWFLNEIQTWLDTQVEKHQIYFWRTSHGTEVDFVVTKGKLIVPFEVTYSQHIDTKKLNNLKNFLQDTSKAQLGIFCYMGRLSYDSKNRILFLPAWMI